jgi:hypothetical protein
VRLQPSFIASNLRLSHVDRKFLAKDTDDCIEIEVAGLGELLAENRKFMENLVAITVPVDVVLTVNLAA